MRSPHTSDKKRIQVHYIGQQLLVDAATTDAEAVLQMTFQDDVRLVGAQMYVLYEVEDAALNADGHAEATGQVSAGGDLLNQTPLLQVTTRLVWTGIMLAGKIVEHMNVWFPEGYGWDFDIGQSIYTVLSNRNGTVVPQSSFLGGIIYWVER